MPLGQDDLHIPMSIDPDTKAMQAAIEKIGQQINDISNRASKGMSKSMVEGMSLSGKEQSEKTKASENLIRGMTEAGRAARPKGIFGQIKEGLMSQLKEGGKINIKQLMGSIIGGGAGGGAGGAAGAGIGGALGALGPVAAGASAALVAVHAGLKMVSGALDELQGSLGPLGIFLSGPLKDILISLVGMTGVANPGVFDQWALALKDIQGVIGQMFTPALIMLTKLVRDIGDAFATALPTGGQMEQLLRSLIVPFGMLGEQLKSLAADPAFQLLVGITIKVLINLIGALAMTIYAVIAPFRALVDIISRLGRLFGIVPAAGQSRSSVGAAASPATFQSLSSYAQSAYTSALSSAPLSPQERTNQILEDQTAILRQIRDRQGGGGENRLNDPFQDSRGPYWLSGYRPDGPVWTGPG